ncbi:Basic blue protein [Hordeum vulgare]|nr:Basic blue protein [Hordeum vulgare]
MPPPHALVHGKTQRIYNDSHSAGCCLLTPHTHREAQQQQQQQQQAMAQGRGRAGQVFALGLLVLCLLLGAATAGAATYNVDWSFAADSWSSGKSFRAGGRPRYNPAVHNVVAVDAGGYNSCRGSSAAYTYTSGSDHVTLVPGTNYFICSLSGHCGLGMKMAVTAN